VGYGAKKAVLGEYLAQGGVHPAMTPTVTPMVG
jgi:hypothetical protein